MRFNTFEFNRLGLENDPKVYPKKNKLYYWHVSEFAIWQIFFCFLNDDTQYSFYFIFMYSTIRIMIPSILYHGLRDCVKAIRNHLVPITGVCQLILFSKNKIKKHSIRKIKIPNVQKATRFWSKCLYSVKIMVKSKLITKYFTVQI